MNGLLLYAAFAVALLLLVAYLVRRTQGKAPAEPIFDWRTQHDWTSSFGLRLGERIFDSSDYYWLRDQGKLPDLARELARRRQELALAWLRGLRRSFMDLIRTPEEGSPATSGNPQSWHLLWLTLRFQCLLGFTLAMVRLFGPYAPLVPSAGWARALLGSTSPLGIYRFASPRSRR